MIVQCGCHCIKCGSIRLESTKVSETGEDGYFDMHHTCQECNTHFDHLEGIIFKMCIICDYKIN